jgi:hypothetical protein
MLRPDSRQARSETVIDAVKPNLSAGLKLSVCVLVTLGINPVVGGPVLPLERCNVDRSSHILRSVVERQLITHFGVVFCHALSR